MFPLNRKISPHLFNNPLQPSTGQLDFIAKYYPDKKDSPNEVMMELYSYSQKKSEQIRFKEATTALRVKTGPIRRLKQITEKFDFEEDIGLMIM